MTGKQKCEVLKKIRRDVAAANDIPLNQPECTHKGECRGTCPRCEAEVKSLEKALADRRRRGLKIAVAGISAGLIALSAASCDAWNALFRGQVQGDLMPPDGDLRLTEDGSTAAEAIEGIVAPPKTEEFVLQGDVPLEDAK